MSVTPLAVKLLQDLVDTFVGIAHLLLPLLHPVPHNGLHLTIFGTGVVSISGSFLGFPTDLVDGLLWLLLAASHPPYLTGNTRLQAEAKFSWLLIAKRLLFIQPASINANCVL